MPGEEGETPGEEPPKEEGAGAAEDANGEPPVVPADNEEAKAPDDKPVEKAAEDAADDAAEEAKKKTLGQMAYDYVYGAPKDDKDAKDPKENIGDRIATDPLELEILETELPEKIDMKTLPQITRGDWEVEWRKIK